MSEVPTQTLKQVFYPQIEKLSTPIQTTPVVFVKTKSQADIFHTIFENPMLNLS